MKTRGQKTRRPLGNKKKNRSGLTVRHGPRSMSPSLSLPQVMTTTVTVAPPFPPSLDPIVAAAPDAPAKADLSDHTPDQPACGARSGAGALEHYLYRYAGMKARVDSPCVDDLIKDGWEVCHIDPRYQTSLCRKEVVDDAVLHVPDLGPAAHRVRRRRDRPVSLGLGRRALPGAALALVLVVCFVVAAVLAGLMVAVLTNGVAGTARR